MSDNTQRWHLNLVRMCWEKHPDGEWIDYDDHVAARAEWYAEGYKAAAKHAVEAAQPRTLTADDHDPLLDEDNGHEPECDWSLNDGECVTYDWTEPVRYDSHRDKGTGRCTRCGAACSCKWIRTIVARVRADERQQARQRHANEGDGPLNIDGCEICYGIGLGIASERERVAQLGKEIDKAVSLMIDAIYNKVYRW